MTEKRASQAGANEVVLYLDGRISARRFRQAVTAFLDFVEEITTHAAGRPNAVEWVISAKGGSINLAARPEAIGSRAPTKKVVRSVASGMRLLARRAQRPQHFTNKALRRLRTLSSVAADKQVKTVQIRVDSQEIALKGDVADHLGILLETPVKDYGAIEGRLQTLSERGGFHFAVYDDLTDEAIRCEVPKDRAEEAWKSFGKRVTVSGEVKYDKIGTPVSITVNHISAFADDSDLPDADDAYGVLSTGADG